MPSIPTYLMSRNGIWYFNYRIPTAVRKRHGITSQFIRKSLRTSNTRQAVLLSKEYISMLMGDNSLMTDPEILKQLNINFNQPSTSEKQANDSVLTDCTCFGVNGGKTIDTAQNGDQTVTAKASQYDFVGTVSYSAYALNMVNAVSLQSVSSNSARKLKAVGITLDELIKKYIDYKVHKKHWKDRTLVSNSQMLQVIKDFLEYVIDTKNPSIESFTYNHAETFEKTFCQYPKNCKKLFPSKSMHQIIGLIKKNQIPHNKQISASTYNEYAQLLMAIFKWAKEKKGEKFLIGENVFVDLKTVPPQKNKEPHFTDSDLHKFFNSDIFTKKNFKVKYAWRYWVPLIMLYHGTRVEECCQLLLNQIVNIQGVDCFVIKNESDSNGNILTTTKNRESVRNVPIHPKLIELGFLDYIKYLKGKNHTKVFPSLSNVRASDGRYKPSGATVSKWFNEESPSTHKYSYFTKVGIDKKKSQLVLYSFRHTVSTLLMNHPDQIDIRKVKRLIGHEVNKTIDSVTFFL